VLDEDVVDFVLVVEVDEIDETLMADPRCGQPVWISQRTDAGFQQQRR